MFCSCTDSGMIRIISHWVCTCCELVGAKELCNGLRITKLTGSACECCILFGFLEGKPNEDGAAAEAIFLSFLFAAALRTSSVER